jgi:hypothetical protein
MMTAGSGKRLAKLFYPNRNTLQLRTMANTEQVQVDDYLYNRIIYMDRDKRRPVTEKDQIDSKKTWPAGFTLI